MPNPSEISPTPSESGKTPEVKIGGPTGDASSKALHKGGGGTLGQFKALLIGQLGPERGKKLYNTFMKNLAMWMVGQVQHAAQQARQQMREAKNAGQ